jgi:hypothetical protein
MKLTEKSRRLLAARKEARDKTKAGWERIYCDSTGKLWELDRGWRRQHRIVAVELSKVAKNTLWVKIISDFPAGSV